MLSSEHYLPTTSQHAIHRCGRATALPQTFYAKVSYRSWPGHLFRIYDTRSGEFLGGVRVKDADERDSAHPGTLRSLFGFDGFIGPSLRSAAEAFEARHVHFTDDDAKKQLVVIA